MGDVDGALEVGDADGLRVVGIRVVGSAVGLVGLRVDGRNVGLRVVGDAVGLLVCRSHHSWTLTNAEKAYTMTYSVRSAVAKAASGPTASV